MKNLDLSQASESLRDYVRNLTDEPLLVTDGGLVVAALVPLDEDCTSSEALAADPRFISLIERARAEHAAGQSKTPVEVRRALGLMP